MVGPPQGGFDKSVLEWSIDVAVDKDTVKKLVDEGLKSKIKNKGDEKGDFITFKRKAVKTDGTPAKSIEIVDHARKAWDPTVKIGNGSKVNIKFAINDVPYGGKTWRKPGILGIQVVELVPYEGGDYEEFPEIGEDGKENWGDE